MRFYVSLFLAEADKPVGRLSLYIDTNDPTANTAMQHIDKYKKAKDLSISVEAG